MNNKRINRRNFGKRAFLTAGGLLAVQYMPNLLLNRVYAGTVSILDINGDKRISISNGSFARPFDVGTWTTLRVCIRATMEGNTSLTSLTPRFVFGLCSGTSNQIFDTTTTNFVGARTTSASWTAQVAAIDWYSVSTPSSYKPTKRVGSTWTDGTAFNSSNPFFVDGTEAGILGCIYIVEVTKGSPNYTIKVFMPLTNPATTAATTQAIFLQQIAQPTPTVTDHILYTGAAFACDEVAGAFNAVTVGWDRTENTLEISDLAVVKMA